MPDRAKKASSADQQTAIFSFQQLPDGAPYLIDLHNEAGHAALCAESESPPGSRRCALGAHLRVKSTGRHNAGGPHQHLIVFALRADEVGRLGEPG